MLLPEKHIKLSESLLGLGAFILGDLGAPKTVDDLWKSLQRSTEEGAYPARHNFENLVLAIDALYALRAVEVNQTGALVKCA